MHGAYCKVLVKIHIKYYINICHYISISQEFIKLTLFEVIFNLCDKLNYF